MYEIGNGLPVISWIRRGPRIKKIIIKKQGYRPCFAGVTKRRLKGTSATQAIKVETPKNTYSLQGFVTQRVTWLSPLSRRWQKVQKGAPFADYAFYCSSVSLLADSVSELAPTSACAGLGTSSPTLQQKTSTLTDLKSRLKPSTVKHRITQIQTPFSVWSVNPDATRAWTIHRVSWR